MSSIGNTANYNLHRMGAGDNFNDQGYKHTAADRDLIDTLLHVGATKHHHDGSPATDFAPTFGPSLGVTTGGSIPASKRVYYKLTYVDDRGVESAASPEVFVDMPAQIAEPSAPTFDVAPSDGTLTGGVWYYVLSAYANSSTEETRALATNNVSLAGATNAVILTLPTLPTGADGFNVYRRGPNEVGYRYLASTVSSDTTYTDDGTVTPNTNRQLPSANVTNATNAATIALPGATPTPLPDGFTWKIYRTFVHGGWDKSFLAHILDPAQLTFADIGFGTKTGRFPDATPLIDNAEKINISDGVEIEGTLPIGLASYPFTVEMRIDGPVAAGPQPWTWVSPHPVVTIVGVRCYLERGSVPASQDIIVDVNFGSGPRPTYSTIFSTQANRPRVPVGQTFGDMTPLPDVNTFNTSYDASTVPSFVVDVDQDGGGASPTDHGLVVQFLCVADGYPTQTFVEGSTIGVLF